MIPPATVFHHTWKKSFCIKKGAAHTPKSVVPLFFHRTIFFLQLWLSLNRTSASETEKSIFPLKEKKSKSPIQMLSYIPRNNLTAVGSQRHCGWSWKLFPILVILWFQNLRSAVGCQRTWDHRVLLKRKSCRHRACFLYFSVLTLSFKERKGIDSLQSSLCFCVCITFRTNQERFHFQKWCCNIYAIQIQ